MKLGLYQRAGVRGYWIVSPEEQTVQVFLNKDGSLLPHEVYDRQRVAKVYVLDVCCTELSKGFPE